MRWNCDDDDDDGPLTLRGPTSKADFCERTFPPKGANQLFRAGGLGGACNYRGVCGNLFSDADLCLVARVVCDSIGVRYGECAVKLMKNLMKCFGNFSGFVEREGVLLLFSGLIGNFGKFCMFVFLLYVM